MYHRQSNRLAVAAESQRFSEYGSHNSSGAICAAGQTHRNNDSSVSRGSEASRFSPARVIPISSFAVTRQRGQSCDGRNAPISTDDFAAICRELRKCNHADFWSCEKCSECWRFANSNTTCSSGTRHLALVVNHDGHLPTRLSRSLAQV